MIFYRERLLKKAKEVSQHPVNSEICITLYKIGKIVLIIGLLALPLYYCGVFEVLKPYNYCVFKRIVGIYCPGCGGTRAVHALLAGHFLESLYLHPAVLYFTSFYLIFMIKMFLKLHYNIGSVSEKRLIGFLYAGIALIFVQWIVKVLVLTSKSMF